MANKIQFKRGIKANLPTLSIGEPAFTTDTNEFFVGNGTGNIKFAKQTDLDTANAQLLENTKKLSFVVYAIDFGAVGDGVTDDGIALNEAFDYLRQKTQADINQGTTCSIDLCGKTYLTTIPLNLTGIISWGWSVENGTIIGKCTGKNVLEMIGSRGGTLENIVIVGDKVNMPYVGIQSARANVGGQYAFCDNMMFDNVHCVGHFALAGIYTYGQETTTYDHCRFWNYNGDGYAAIHSGFDKFPIVHDYMQPITGSTSYINNKYVNVDYRYLPTISIVNITGISKASTAVVTAPNHPFQNGDTITIIRVGGMGEINNQKFTVANKTTNTFELSGINSTAYTTYTSGGTAIKCQTVPTVYFARGHQHSFDTCYIVNYGSDSMQIDFPDTINPEQLTLDILFEGSGTRSHVRFTNGTGNRKIIDFILRTYSTHARNCLLSTDSSGSGNVGIYNGEISVASNANFASGLSYLPILDTEIRYALYATIVNSTHVDSFKPKNLANFTGEFSNLSDGNSVLNNFIFTNSADNDFTPVVTASIGSIASYTASGSFRKIGNLAFIEIYVNVTNNGTGSGAVLVTIPSQAFTKCCITGQDIGVSNKTLLGFINTATNAIIIRDYSGAYPASTGSQLVLSGFYQIA